MKKTLITTLLCCFLFASHSFAEEPDPIDMETTTASKIDGFKFGVAVGLTMNLGEDNVEKAELINNIVRIKKEGNYQPGFMLETHYFFTPGEFLGHKRGEWGLGPFVGIQTGSNEVIKNISAGMMIGFRRTERDESFNIGLGIALDPSVQVLGDGIEENKVLPADYDGKIFLKETGQWGVLALLSYAF